MKPKDVFALAIQVLGLVFWFLDVLSGMGYDTHGTGPGSINPNGIEPFSPGLRGTSYPG
jgi:hypothetical protein